jgi:ATP-dependent DNA helicase RecQ
MEGLALSIYGDAGWGAMVAEDKYRVGRFRTELIDAAARVIRDAWHPNASGGWWLTAVPSRKRTGLVGEASQGIAMVLGLPYREVLAKTFAAAPQKDMQNSAMQLSNAWHTLEITGDVLPGPVILVDDIVDSRWTMTVAGHLLTIHGAGRVHPFAFGEAAAGDDA